MVRVVTALRQSCYLHCGGLGRCGIAQLTLSEESKSRKRWDNDMFVRKLKKCVLLPPVRATLFGPPKILCSQTAHKSLFKHFSNSVLIRSLGTQEPRFYLSLTPCMLYPAANERFVTARNINGRHNNVPTDESDS